MDSGGAAVAAPAWRASLQRHVETRRAAEVVPWAPLARALEVAAAEVQRLRSQNASLQSHVDALRAEIAAGGTNASPGGAAVVAKLQARLLELQDEVTAHYKGEMEAVRERLALSEANQRLKDDAARAMADAQRATAAQRAAQDELERTRAMLKDREAKLGVMAEEHARVRELLDARASEADALRRENEAMVGRVLNEKAAAAENVRSMSELLETARRERDRSAEHLAGARSRIEELARALAAVQAAGVVNPTAAGVAVSGGSPATTAEAPPGAVHAAPPVAPPTTHTHTHTSTHGRTASTPGAPGSAQSAASGQAGNPFSWLGNAIRQAAGAAVATVAAPAPGAATHTHTHTGVAAPGHSAPASLADSTGSMTASVAGIMSDYVLAYMPVPSRLSTSVRAHEAEINCVRFNENGRLLATASSDGNVGLYDPGSGSRQGSLYSGSAGNAVLAVDFIGNVVLGGCTDRSVRVWDIATQRCVRTCVGHGGKVHAVVYLSSTGGLTPQTGALGASASASRGMVFSGGADRVVKLWDMRDGRCVRTIDTKSIVNSIAVTPDGLLLVVANQDFGVRMFDVRNGGKLVENMAAHSGPVTSVAFSRGDGCGRVLTASRDNTLRLLDGRTLEPLHAFMPPSSALGAASGVMGVLGSLASGGSAPQAGGDTTASSSGIVMRQSAFRVSSNQARAVLSGNNQFAAAGGANGYVYLWSCETGELEVELGNSRAAAARARRERATAAAEGRAPAKSRTSSVAGGDEDMFGGAFASETSPSPVGPSRLDEPHEGKPVLSVDWAPDGSCLASGDEAGRLCLWA